jgi:hypothetical protein
VTASSYLFEYHDFWPPCKRRRSHLLLYDNDVMMAIVVVVAEFSSLFLFRNYFQINPGMSRW